MKEMIGVQQREGGDVWLVLLLAVLLLVLLVARCLNCLEAVREASLFFFQAEDGIRDLTVTGRRVLFRSSASSGPAASPRSPPGSRRNAGPSPRHTFPRGQ